MKNKKVGIITIHSDLNYGAALQAFALNQVLKDNGYSSEIINYIKIPNFPPKYPFPLNIVFWLSNRMRFRRFRNFLKGSVTKKSWNSIDEMMSSFNEDFDVIVSGSDQVWNPFCGGLVTEINPIYYLAFADHNKYKKVAYASSLGSHRFTEEEKQIVSKWFLEYDHLSTREQAGKEHLESFLDRDVKVVVDPTLLLDREKWLREAKPIRLPEKYVLVYYFDERDEVIRIARKIADKYGYKVALFTNMPYKFDGVDYNIRNCGPSQFLWAFENASYVVTNSFHGTAFAVNFNKDFISVIKRNSPQRAQNLLNSVGLPERLLVDESHLDALSEHINWEEPNRKLENIRRDSLQYLLSAIED